MNRSLGLIHSQRITGEQRASARQPLGLSGRVIWKDARGTTHFNQVIVRDASDTGAYIENLAGAAIPLYRLVSLQVDRGGQPDAVPTALRGRRVLSAVYRVGPAHQVTGMPEGYGLRLLVEPRRRKPAAAPRCLVTLATA
jgi:hypothetical protein